MATETGIDKFFVKADQQASERNNSRLEKERLDDTRMNYVSYFRELFKADREGKHILSKRLNKYVESRMEGYQNIFDSILVPLKMTTLEGTSQEKSAVVRIDRIIAVKVPKYYLEYIAASPPLPSIRSLRLDLSIIDETEKEKHLPPGVIRHPVPPKKEVIYITEDDFVDEELADEKENYYFKAFNNLYLAINRIDV